METSALAYLAHKSGQDAYYRKAPQAGGLDRAKSASVLLVPLGKAEG